MYGFGSIRCICNNQTPDGMFNLACSSCGYYVHGICYQIRCGPIICVECKGQNKDDDTVEMTEDKNELSALVKRLAFSLAQGEHRYFFGDEPSNIVASIFLELRFNIHPDWAKRVLDISLENMILSILPDGLLEYNDSQDQQPNTGSVVDVSSFLKVKKKDVKERFDYKTEVDKIKTDPDSSQSSQPARVPSLNTDYNNIEPIVPDHTNDQDDSKETINLAEPEIKLEAGDDSFEMPLPPPSKKRGKLKKRMKFKTGAPKAKGPVKCEDCDYVGADKSSVRNHRESVHLKIRYKCPQCEHEATRKADLKQHILSIHEGKRYDCDQCGVTFSYPSALKLHIRQIHEGKRYYCDQCNKDYSQPGQLKEHIKTVHEGVVFMCDQCPYQASYKSMLLQHKKSKHEGVRYQCELCPYQAPTRRNLSAHKKRVHLGIRYHCDECDYSASTPSLLKSHKEVKHEGKVYPCNQCNYSSSFKYKTTQHILTQHEGVRYNCELCSYKTAHAGDVLKHKRKAHSELYPPPHSSVLNYKV